MISCANTMIKVKILKKTFDSSLGEMKVGSTRIVTEAVATRWARNRIAEVIGIIKDGGSENGRETKQGNSEGQAAKKKPESFVPEQKKHETVTKAIIQDTDMVDDPEAEDLLLAAKEEKQTVLDLMPEHEIRALAKELKVRSFHNMGIDKLKEKIRAVSEY